MEEREYNRIGHIKTKRNEKDSVMEKTQQQKDWDLMIKKEKDLIKREDRQENVFRINKANEYRKQKVLDRIEYDNLKSNQINKEKEKLMETRFAVRREAERQK